MPALNTYHTLNDYRLSVEPVSENESTSKWGAAALVIAIFLGGGAYLYYSAHQPSQQGSADTAPVSTSESTNYQAPVTTEGAVESAVPSDALSAYRPRCNRQFSLPPIAPPDANTRVPTQAPVMDRSVVRKRMFRHRSQHSAPNGPPNRSLTPPMQQHLPHRTSRRLPRLHLSLRRLMSRPMSRLRPLKSHQSMSRQSLSRLYRLPLTKMWGASRLA
jgi:hypothetical protein